MLDTNDPSTPNGVDVREEYANAFRTESYNQFWTRVLALSTNSNKCIHLESSASARLPSYRLFVENLLDPDQETVTRILALARNANSTCSAISEYFTTTANASHLCGLLLKDIDHTRVKYRAFKATLRSLDMNQLSPENHLPIVLTRLTEFTKSPNPFNISAPSPSRVRVTQTDCAKLLKKLESSRDKTKAKLRLKSKLKHGSALVLVALTTSLTIIVATHALALLVAAPTLMTAISELASSRRLAKVSAQLDAAAKGTYILSRDLEIISRLVARLNDELEDMHAMVRFWVERGEDWLRANEEVVRQLKMNECSFSQQLDELEEHLYLCFMTINRARTLVIKEMLDPGSKFPNILSK